MIEEGVNYAEVVDSLPEGTLAELKNVVYSAKLMPNGDWKFKNKSNNVSAKNHLLNVDTFIDYLWSNYRKELRSYPFQDVLDDKLMLLKLLEFLSKDINANELQSGSVAGSTVLNWSSASGSKYENARSMKYWKLNETDIKFLRHIKVAYAGEGHGGTLVVYIRCSERTNTYVQLDTIESVKSSSVISKLASIKTSKGSLLCQVEKEYIDYVENVYEKERNKFPGCVFGAIVIDDNEGNVEYCAPAFDDYLKAVVKQLHLTDMRLRLPKEPVIISSDPDEPAFYHFNKSAIMEPGEWGHWRDWMDVIPDESKAVFMAWVYSVFVPRNKGRQALWLHSEGYDGKSQVTLALSRYMEERGVGSINSQQASGQFSFAGVYGKRLLIFGDCRNDRFLSTGTVHSVLGGDMVSVERKFKEAFTSRVFSKLLVCSNVAPEMDANAMHETSRVIYIRLKQPRKEIRARFLATNNAGDILYDEQGNPTPVGFNGKNGKELNEYLLEEMNAFLHECRKKYLELCPNDKEIVVSDAAKESLYDSCVSEESVQYEKYISENYVFHTDNPGEYVMDIKDRAIDHFNDPMVSKRFNKFNIKAFMDAFMKNAKRQLRRSGTPIDDYRITRRQNNGRRAQFLEACEFKGKEVTRVNLS